MQICHDSSSDEEMSENNGDSISDQAVKASVAGTGGHRIAGVAKKKRPLDKVCAARNVSIPNCWKDATLNNAID
jgi:hypothetical protein